MRPGHRPSGGRGSAGRSWPQCRRRRWFLGSEHSGPIDALLTDAVMPGMSAKVLARATRPRTRVIFTSGYTDDAVLERNMVESASLSFRTVHAGRPGVPQAVKLKALMSGTGLSKGARSMIR